MQKDKLTNLLNDLYEKYNTDHLQYVPSLVDKYSSSPYQAIEMVFFKYNHPSLPNFDPVKSTEPYIIQLIKDYEAGKRTFKQIDIIQDAQKSKEQNVMVVEEERTKTSKEIAERVKETNEQQKEELAKFIDNKIEAFKKTITEIMNEKNKDENVEYTVIVSNTDETVILPNKKQISNLGINSRIIAKTESGKPIGLIIKDITYDSLTSDDKVIISIFLERS